MTLEELQDLADKDLKIDESNLSLESIKTPQLHNKYLKFLNKYKLLLVKAEDDYKLLKKYKWEYYTGKAEAQVYKEQPFDLKILSLFLLETFLSLNLIFSFLVFIYYFFFPSFLNIYSFEYFIPFPLKGSGFL